MIRTMSSPETIARTGRREWHNEPVIWFLELYGDASGTWRLAADDSELPAEIAAILRRVIPQADWCCLIVHALSSGYYDPGKTWGLPENCYPPEGSEERVLDHVDCEIQWDREHNLVVRLPQEDAQRVFDRYEQAICEAEIAT